MKFRELEITGLFEIELFHAEDQRGSFTKSFHGPAFKEQGLQEVFRESFYSTNHKGVIRGMHFQNPPHDHDKLVYCTAGRILDVVLDLRKNSGSYGKFVTIEISSENHKAVYIPKGLAHGFCCLTEATMIYLTSTVHNSKSDNGVRWDSFGMQWPEESPIMSERDQRFQTFHELISPF